MLAARESCCGDRLTWAHQSRMVVVVLVVVVVVIPITF